MGVEFLGRGESGGIHGRLGSGDEHGLMRFDVDGAAGAVVDDGVFRCDAGEAWDDAGVAHALVDET